MLKFPVESSCFVLFNMLLQKLDNATKTALLPFSQDELPTFNNLLEFLENHCRALEAVQYNSPSSQTTFKEKSNGSNNSFTRKNK